MTVIIAGCRHITDPEVVATAIALSGFTISEVVSGEAPGVDTEGGNWGHRHGIPVKGFPADWVKFRRAAGPLRNEEMAKYAAEREGGLIAVWDGKSRGTRDMIFRAQHKGLKVFVHRI